MADIILAIPVIYFLTIGFILGKVIWELCNNKHTSDHTIGLWLLSIILLIVFIWSFVSITK